MRAPARPHSRLPIAGAGALTAVLLLGGCGSMQTHPEAQSTPAGPTPAETTAAAAPTTAGPSLTADLVGSKDGRAASVAVTVSDVQTGIPPLYVDGGLAADCQLDPATTEYAKVSVLFVSRSTATKQTGNSANLRLDLRVDDGSAAGVLVEAQELPETSCDGGAPAPADAVLQTENLSDEHQTLTAYVVAHTGAAGADPLRGATLELLDLRHHPDDIDSTDWTWGPQDVAGGSTCADDPDSLCLLIG